MRRPSSADRDAAPDAVVALLADAGLVEPDEPLWAEPLTGGVSSEIWLVGDARDLRVVVKSPLEKLRVEQEWHASPERGESEARWLAAVSALVPGACPDVLAHDPERRLLALTYLPPSHHRSWKAELMAGRVDAGFAGGVGALLGEIHRRAAGDPTLAGEFDNAGLFRELRIEPYFESLAPHHPDLVAPLADLVDELTAPGTTLAHGDVSPKNILVGPHGPVLLDAEAASWGDPAFDVAFCLTHLLLKCLVHPERTADLAVCVEALHNRYLAAAELDPSDPLAGRVARFVPALMLARVDGRSPVEYLTPEAQATVRGFARDWVHDAPDTVTELVTSWKKELA